MDAGVVAAIVSGAATVIGIALTVALGNAASRRADRESAANRAQTTALELLRTALDEQRDELDRRGVQIDGLRDENDHLRTEVRRRETHGG